MTETVNQLTDLLPNSWRPAAYRFIARDKKAPAAKGLCKTHCCQPTVATMRRKKLHAMRQSDAFFVTRAASSFVTIGFGRDTTMAVSLYGLKGANLTPQINFKQRLKKCLAKLGLCLVSR